jgi:hypothetical protein
MAENNPQGVLASFGGQGQQLRNCGEVPVIPISG